MARGCSWATKAARWAGWPLSLYDCETVDLAAEHGLATGRHSRDASAGDRRLRPQAGGGNYLPATMTSPDFGAQAFLWWRPEIADRDLDLMREAGFNWVKQTFAWETIEGAGQGVYDWSVADRVVTHVNRRG